jgi:hypothetical protein
MRDNELRPAVLAFLLGVVIIASAIGAFLEFVGDGSGGEPDRSRESLAQRLGLLPQRPACLNAKACREPATEFAAAYDNPSACDGTLKRVCLVPLGDVPKDLVDHLVAYYREEYALTLHVLPAVALEPGFEAGRPGQLRAQELEEVYRAAYPEQAKDLNLIMIGLTAIDIYTEERPEWRWFFGYSGKHSLISIFRMDPANWGRPRDDDLRNKRVRTLMNKYVAMRYFGLPVNDNPRSVLFRQFGSLDALDYADEHIPLPSNVTHPIQRRCRRFPSQRRAQPTTLVRSVLKSRDSTLRHWT